jgi:hypothetical protein
MTDTFDTLTDEIKRTVVASLATHEQERKMAEVTALKVPSREDFVGDDGARIGKLTTEAVMKSSEQASRDVMASVQQAEGVCKMLREEAEQLSQEVKHHAEVFSARVGKAIDAMRDITLSMRERRENLTTQFLPPTDKRAAG